ncbi:hypothetical protein LTR86_008526 [Recurvomyces mirabilis]|nr:hypothetical protein LTR86_008526 [Recurvomyces mirabilis]
MRVLLMEKCTYPDINKFAMSRKRPASEVEDTMTRPRRLSSKRTKFIPSEDVKSDRSEPSSCSVSVASALESSPGATEQREHQSSVSSVSANSADDSEISLSSSSEEPSDDDDEDDTERIVTIGGPKKPLFKPARELGTGAGDLQARISALLPRLRDANALLEEDGGTSFSMEEVDEDEQHIEMDLGLGVLEEQNGSESDDSSGEEDDGLMEQEQPVFSDAVNSAHESKEGHAMERLMGRSKGEHREVGIREVDL